MQFLFCYFLHEAPKHKNDLPLCLMPSSHWLFGLALIASVPSQFWRIEKRIVGDR